MSSQLMEAQAAYYNKNYLKAHEICERLYPLRDSLAPVEKSLLMDVRAASLYNLRRYTEAARARGEQVAHHQKIESEPLRIAALQSMHAWALYQDGQYNASLTESGKSYLTRQTLLGSAAPQTLSSLHVCIYNLNKLDRYQEMLALAEELVVQRAATLPADSAELIDARSWHDRAKRQIESAQALPHAVASGEKRIKKNPRSTKFQQDKNAATKSDPDAVKYVHAIASGVTRGIARGIVEALL